MWGVRNSRKFKKILENVFSAWIAGFCAAPLWSSKAQYLTVSAGNLAKLTNERTDTIVNQFFGIFFCIFQLNQIFGNLISATVIGDGFPTFSALPRVSA